MRILIFYSEVNRSIFFLENFNFCFCIFGMHESANNSCRNVRVIRGAPWFPSRPLRWKRSPISLPSLPQLGRYQHEFSAGPNFHEEPRLHGSGRAAKSEFFKTWAGPESTVPIGTITKDDGFRQCTSCQERARSH